ncbi:MAG TPA: triose-phosphate isomerase [Caldilineaceae bacterium]|nr:triose-phosphate isomerase [Caldilineaceae bacterium]
MRKPMMAANWKMNKTVDEAVALAEAIRDGVGSIASVDRVLCPPFVSLAAVRQVVQGTGIAVGAQNVHWAESGAYTGEISAAMLKGLADYVIIGHSERRQYFAETDETVNKKVHAALAAGLIPIVCVGESLAQNEAGETHAFVRGQVKAALAGLSGDQVQGLLIAYEPIWAIGTGKAATAQQAQQICGDTVRATVAELYGPGVAEFVRILYGGSTNAKNIEEIMEQPDIDGALIGGASLQADSYNAMVRVTADLYAAAAR